jgi:hypothetical protein
MNKVEQFKCITKQMSDLYEIKNHDYGDSFGNSIKTFGPIAGVVRISDKFERLKQLTLNKEQKVNESIEDTLLDLANYSIMLLIEFQNSKINS